MVVSSIPLIPSFWRGLKQQWFAVAVLRVRFGLLGYSLLWPSYRCESWRRSLGYHVLCKWEGHHYQGLVEFLADVAGVQAIGAILATHPVNPLAPSVTHSSIALVVLIYFIGYVELPCNVWGLF